jgi:hypothetical protein
LQLDSYDINTTKKDNMKSLVILAVTVAASTSLLAADSSSKDDVKGAVDKLAAADSYSWTTTVESPQFSPGPSHGKMEKGGYTWVDFSFQDNTMEGLVKDGKGAIKSEDGWQGLADAAKDSGDGGGGFNPKMMMVRRLQNMRTPPMDMTNILANVKDLTKGDGVYSGDLTEAGAKNLMTFGRRRGGGQGPAISNAKGSVKFWVKDGIVSKYELKVSGTMNRNGDDVDIDRTTTVEIKDIGSTKVTIPDEAKSKIS